MSATDIEDRPVSIAAADHRNGVSERLKAGLAAVGLDPQRFIFAVNIALAAILALYFAFLVNLPNTFWALLTIPLVMKQQSGMTVWRSLARFTGTMIGALVGLLFVSVFAQDGLTMIVALSLWLLATGILARFEVGIDAYAYGVAGLTTLIITMDTGPAADLAYTYAVSRTTETVIAIVAGFTVVLVVFPQSIIPTLKTSIARAREKVFDVAKASVSQGEEPSTGLRRDVAASLREAFTNLRAWRFETAPDKSGLSRLRSQTSLLARVTAAAEALTFVTTPYREDDTPPAKVEAARARLQALIEAVPTDEHSVAVAIEHADELQAFASDIREHADHSALADHPTAERLEEVSALFRMVDLAETLVAFLQAESAVLDPRRPYEEIPPASTRYVDLVAAIQLGLRPALAFFALALFWIFSGWGNGRILALITGALSLLIPTIAPRAMMPAAGKKIGLGFVTMVPVALLLMAVLPSMQSFWGFALTMGAVIFVLFYICGEQQNLPLAIGGTVMLAIGLQPTNLQVYDPLRLINAGATLALMPVAFIVSVNLLFPNTAERVRRHLRRGTDDLLAKAARNAIPRVDFLAQSIDLLADYGGDLDMDIAANRHHVERARGATQVGLELYAIRRIAGVKTADDLCRSLSDAAIAASRKRRDDDPAAELDAVVAVADNARKAISETDAPERLVHHRVAMASELVGAMIAQRRLALPGGDR